MSHFWDVTITVEIDDEDIETLYQTARAAALSGHYEGEPDDYLKKDDEISVRDCLIMIFDPGISPPGVSIIESNADACPRVEE